jgi:hypothetical protein
MNPMLTLILATPDPDTVTPGPIGFAAILFVGIAVILLGLDMVRRIRRTTYRAEIQQRLADEMAARDAAQMQQGQMHQGQTQEGQMQQEKNQPE